MRIVLKVGLALGVLMQEKMVKIPIQVEATDAGALLSIDGSCVNEVEPQHEHAPIWDASAHGSLDMVDLGANGLGLPGYP
jgi:hypothetical protein